MRRFLLLVGLVLGAVLLMRFMPHISLTGGNDFVSGAVKSTVK